MGDFPNLDIKIINIYREAEWRVPAIAYNTGFSAAKGDVIMINSVDTIHAGDVIGHVFNNFDLNCYFSYATAWSSIEFTESLINREWSDDFREDILKRFDPSILGWRVHGSIGTYIPFCGVINSSDLDKLNGYDERFTGGIGYDDHDFEDRVYNLGLNMQIINEPFCIHQDHPIIEYSNTRNIDLLTDLRAGYPKRIKADCNKYYKR
jgi:hypothetical protein